MKIRVDADACPGVPLITNLAEKYQIELILYCDNTHQITSEYGTVIICDKGFQSVDMKLMNDIEKNDIIITQDYGIAVVALAKKSHAIHPKGSVYTDENMDIMLFERHLNTKQRNKRNIRGPKKRTSEDDKKLYSNLCMLIEKNI